MRILLDACVPRRLAKELSGHEVQTAPKMGWGDLDDDPLLDAIAGHFDVLVTVDKNPPKQQRLDNWPFAVIVLRAETNRLVDLFPHVPSLCLAFKEIRPGQVYEAG